MLQIIELLNAKLNNENESVSFSSHQIWIHHHHVKETKKLQHMVDEKSAIFHRRIHILFIFPKKEGMFRVFS
jgi:hypothetical protein